jgi:membrane protein implicated in regulation of membrane protease activity
MPARMLGRITLALVTIALVIAALLAAGTSAAGSAPTAGELVAMTAGAVASVLLTAPGRLRRLLASRQARSRTPGSR